ncbi:MAG: hypothetical protein KTR14_09670 [Vampirovibrio sp.]|nr:hypothetical protein [Vampirovibrio sp.]
MLSPWFSSWLAPKQVTTQILNGKGVPISERAVSFATRKAAPNTTALTSPQAQRVKQHELYQAQKAFMAAVLRGTFTPNK